MKLGSENEILEYKKSTGELKEGIISIVAILNKHNGGELYFGIRNDGTPVGQDISDKTVRDISQAIHRNPLLARILYYSKDIEHFGTGLRRIVSVCRDADVKVEFKQTKIGFTIVFHRFDKAVDKMGRVVTDKMTDKTDIPTDITNINPREATLIEYLRVNEFISNKKACELLSISTEAIKRLLQSMVQKGLIIAEGENKGRRYKL